MNNPSFLSLFLPASKSMEYPKEDSKKGNYKGIYFYSLHYFCNRVGSIYPY